MSLSPAQLSQRQMAGKSRWQQLVKHALNKYPGQFDLAARWLTGQMKNHHFRHHRGITLRYMELWADRLGGNPHV